MLTWQMKQEYLFLEDDHSIYIHSKKAWVQVDPQFF